MFKEASVITRVIINLVYAVPNSYIESDVLNVDGMSLYEKHGLRHSTNH